MGHVSATSETLRVVSQRVSIINPTIVALPPYRENASYRVHERTDLSVQYVSLKKPNECVFPKIFSDILRLQ